MSITRDAYKIHKIGAWCLKKHIPIIPKLLGGGKKDAFSSI